MQMNRERNRDRVKSAIAVAAFHALLGYALIVGLGYNPVVEAKESLKLFDVLPERPPPPVPEPARAEAQKEKPKPKDPEGAASPKSLRNTPTPIVLPPPTVRLEAPSPVVVAPVAGVGTDASAGVSDVPGTGTGTGGQGTGTGSGASGDGNGGGGGGGMARPARWIEGRIRNADYPSSAVRARAQGTVFLRFTVAPTGRISQCTVTRSSGVALLDETTCRLIKRRFRYRPARDGKGDPTSDVISGEHLWELGPEPPPTDVEPDIPD